MLSVGEIMSVLATVVPLQPVVVAGRTHSGFELRASAQVLPGANPSSVEEALWVIERMPLYYTITLVEAFVESAGEVTLTFRSDLESKPEPWHEFGSLVFTDDLRSESLMRVTAPCRRLVIRMQAASASPGTVVRVRLTLVNDHRN